MGSQGLKEEWGLKDAQEGAASPGEDGAKGQDAGSDAQAKAFKASFNKAVGSVSASLQYTAANAEEAKHAAMAAKNDSLYAAYQAALGKIDPANKSVAAGDIEKVLADAATIGQEAAQLKSETETAKQAFEARVGERQTAEGQVDEVEAWGLAEAGDLLATVREVDQLEGERKWDQAGSALGTLIANLEPAYAEYLRQKAAKDEYDVERPAFNSAFETANSHPLPSEEMTRIADQIANQLPAIDGFAGENDFVEALEQLRLLGDPLQQLEKARLAHEERQREYESRLAALQADLGNATVSEFEILTPMQEELAALQGTMEEAAAGGDYEQALTHLGNLEIKVRDFLVALEEEREKQRRREEFELRAADIEGRMPTESRFASLDDMQQDMIAVQGQARSAAEADDFDAADAHLDDLEQKLDVYDTELEALLQKQEEYERRVEELLPRIQAVNECEYAQLDELLRGVAEAQALVDESRVSAEAEDYDTALMKVGDAEGKVEAFEAALEEIERQRADYEGRLAALEPSLKEALAFSYDPFKAMQTSISTTRDEMETAAGQHEYEVALGLLDQLNTLLEEFFHAVEAEKARFASEFGAIQSDYDKVFLVAYAYDTLAGDRTSIEGVKKAADAALAKEDFKTAFDKLNELKPKVTAYNTKAEAEQKQYDDKGAEIIKALDAAGYMSRDDKAREIVDNLTPDQLKHIPTDARNRLMKELQEGNFSDEDKEAVHMLYSVRTMDPEFEAAEKEHRRELIESMKNDPAFKEARDNWGTMNEAERLELIQNAVNKTVDAYGLEGDPPEVTTKDVPPKTGPDGATWINNGSYSHSANEVKINTNTQCAGTLCPALTDFDDSVELAVHETLHRHQHQLGEGVEDGTIPPDDVRYEQGQALALNDDYYVYSKDVGNIYLTQPMETHSRVNEEAIENAGIGQ